MSLGNIISINEINETFSVVVRLIPSRHYSLIGDDDNYHVCTRQSLIFY